MPSVQIHVQKYEDMILRRGRRVKWQETITCSCVNIDSGQPQYECGACKGKGYVLSEPVEDVVLLMSVTHNKEFEEMAGIFEIGDAIMTVGRFVPEINPKTNLVNKQSRGRENPIFHIGMYDLITLTDDEYKTSEVLTKATPYYMRPADTLLNHDVIDVKSIRHMNPQTGDITIYEKDKDYTWKDNKITWISQALGDGEQYTVQYTHRPVFIVLKQLPTPRYQDGQDLPKKVAIRFKPGGFDKQ